MVSSKIFKEKIRVYNRCHIIQELTVLIKNVFIKKQHHFKHSLNIHPRIAMYIYLSINILCVCKFHSLLHPLAYEIHSPTLNINSNAIIITKRKDDMALKIIKAVCSKGKITKREKKKQFPWSYIRRMTTVEETARDSNN